MEPESPLRHTKHIFRVTLLLFFVLAVLMLGRGFFVPDSWGEYGWYRGDSVEEHRSRAVRHGGDEACRPCHEEQIELRETGSHTSVRCELCHAPVVEHIEDGEVIKEMVIAPSLELCSRCHRHLNARPSDFPQVNPRQHVEENEGEFSDNVCVECHDPHSPL